jgi:hypothetical protein
MKGTTTKGANMNNDTIKEMSIEERMQAEAEFVERLQEQIRAKRFRESMDRTWR